MAESAQVDAIGVLAESADTLLDLDLNTVPDDTVLALVSALETHRRRLAAFEHDLYTELVTRHLHGVHTEQGLADILVPLLRITPADARARAARATELGPRRTLAGEPLPPLMPATADAARTGAISDQHAAVIARALDAVPADASLQVTPAVEQLLLDAATREHPTHLERTATVVLAQLDTDGLELSDEHIDRMRGLTLHRRADGTVSVSGILCPETAILADTIFDALAAPAPSADGAPDPRSAAQRRHDALRDVFERVLQSDTLPSVGGTPLTVLIRTRVEDITPAGSADSASENTAAFGISAHGHLIRLSRLQHLGLGEATLTPVLITPAGAVLDLGRSQRLASCSQRRALTVRDGGCSFPGCDRPASWSEVHHVTPWAEGGTTDITNLCLLCPYHHRTFESHGWTVHMRDGIPEWTPPAWLDPEQRPRHNTANHPPDITFRPPQPLRR